MIESEKNAHNTFLSFFVSIISSDQWATELLNGRSEHFNINFIVLQNTIKFGCSQKNIIKLQKDFSSYRSISSSRRQTNHLDQCFQAN